MFDATSDFEGMKVRQLELSEVLEQIAAIAHHGPLIGFSDEYAALNEIRRLSLSWWDMSECSRLEIEREQVSDSLLFPRPQGRV